MANATDYCGRCWAHHDLAVLTDDDGSTMALCDSCRVHYGYLTIDAWLDLLAARHSLTTED